MNALHKKFINTQYGVVCRVPRTFASLMSVRGMGAGFALVPQADVRFANVAELRESTQYVRLRALRKQRSCSHALRCSRAHYAQAKFNINRVLRHKNVSQQYDLWFE